jgi:UDP-N-acetylmuramoyl-tripeptide--D-alanyl-D-alanine ligase
MSDRFDMAPTTLSSILAVLAPGWHVEGAHGMVVDQVCIDSRNASSGSLFVALAGENVDGHDYVPAAFAAGARMALVERSVADLPCVDTLERTAPPLSGSAVTVRVPSTLGALQALAAERRTSHPGLKVIGITGSVGKTTTKEAVAFVLGARYRVLKSEGNRNNEIGLPLTLLTALPEHNRAVLEMGMYQLGEIADLCRVAVPQAGLVTNVEPVHLERLGSIEKIAEAKAELVRALPADGWAALNADDDRVLAMAQLTGARVVSYGCAPAADVRLTHVTDLGLKGNSFAVRIKAGLAEARADECNLRTGMLGAAAARAALAAVTVGLLEGLSWIEIQQGLDDLGQGLRLVSRAGKEGMTILDDCYNASPSSVISALRLLGSLSGRRVAVLGDMLELGAIEVEGHRQVGRVAANTCQVLVTVGSRARDIALAAGEHGLPAASITAVADSREAIAHLSRALCPSDVVLVKGSRGMRMEEIVSSLLEAR